MRKIFTLITISLSLHCAGQEDKQLQKLQRFHNAQLVMIDSPDTIPVTHHIIDSFPHQGYLFNGSLFIRYTTDYSKIIDSLKSIIKFQTLKINTAKYYLDIVKHKPANLVYLRGWLIRALQ